MLHFSKTSIVTVFTIDSSSKSPLFLKTQDFKHPVINTNWFLYNPLHPIRDQQEAEKRSREERRAVRRARREARGEVIENEEELDTANDSEYDSEGGDNGEGVEELPNDKEQKQ